jgi:hypothetical protein
MVVVVLKEFTDDERFKDMTTIITPFLVSKEERK